MVEKENKEVESTLGLTLEDLKECNVDVEDMKKEIDKPKKKKKEYLLNDKQFRKFSYIVCLIGLICTIFLSIFKPDLSIEISDMQQYFSIVFTWIFMELFKFTWLITLFEVLVIVFNKVAGKFYRTWTYITLFFMVSVIVGIFKIYVLQI